MRYMTYLECSTATMGPVARAAMRNGGLERAHMMALHSMILEARAANR